MFSYIDSSVSSIMADEILNSGPLSADPRFSFEDRDHLAKIQRPDSQRPAQSIFMQLMTQIRECVNSIIRELLRSQG